MDMLFQPNTDSTPLPSQLHMPLHLSLLAIGVGASGDCGVEGALGDCSVEGASRDCGAKCASMGVGALGDIARILGQDVDTSTRGASTDDTIESDDHLVTRETQVHI